MMNFETLANELLLDLFEYFDGLNLFRAFYGLNYRLNHLLYYHFDFRSISKQKFNRLCHEYIPLISQQIMSLCLSNDDETPNLPEIFFSYTFIFNHLKSLSIYGIYSIDSLNQIIEQCQSLIYLKHFKIIHFRIDGEQDKITLLMNRIWNLSLTHCHFEDFYSGGQYFFNIQTKSLSIKYLSIYDIYCDMNVLYHLFEYTPNLKQLTISSDYSSSYELLNQKYLSIKILKLSFEGSIHPVINLIENLPNLSYLTLKTYDIFLNGYEWKEIIENNLPKIKTFHLRMNVQFNNSNNKDEEIDNLLETFQTYFWIEQHQWFVQCDWELDNSSNRAILYTLPYDFGDFFYFDTLKSKSTCPNRNFSYNRVNILRQSFSDNLPLENPNRLTPKFYKIYDLTINIPFDNHFLSCIPSLDQLKTLDVTVQEDDSAYFLLQILLNRAINLYSLKLRSSTNLQMNLIEIHNQSIRRLDIMTKSALRLQYFNSEECFLLAQSSIGKQCQVLLISIENRRNICELIQIMPNLRSLTIQCKDDKYNYKRSISIHDELIQWLSEHLSSELLIFRNKSQTSRVHIWIQ